MPNEFNSNSMIKYLIGASRVKFTVLDDIFKPYHIMNKHLVLYIDAHSILYRLYRNDRLGMIYSIPVEVAVKDLVVSFLNVIGHYRRYIATHLNLPHDIIITWNTECDNYHLNTFSDYRKSEYEKYKKNHKDYSGLNQIVFQAMKFVQSIVPYFEGIYFVDNKDVDDFAVMKYYMAHYDEQYKDDVFHLIFSKNLIPNQLINNRCFQLVGKRDSSYLISNLNTIEYGILKDKKTTVSGIGSELLPFIWALGGCNDADMKRSKFSSGIVSSTKQITELVNKKIITPNMSIQEFLKEYSKQIDKGIEIKATPGYLTNRYKAMNIDLAVAAITSNQKIVMQRGMIDLYDQTALEEINEQLANINSDGELIDITNLNMTGEIDNWYTDIPFAEFYV